MSSGPYSVFCLRYYPDLVTGEFVNVGLALVGRNGWWSVRLAEDLRDVRCLFPSAQPAALKRILRQLDRRIGSSAGTLALEPETAGHALDPVRRRLGRLHGSLRWSDSVFEGTSDDFSTEVDHWFSTLVHVADTARDEMGGAAARSPTTSTLRGLMEQEFVRRGIMGQLRRTRISGYYPTTFRYTYRNGTLNIFEPIKLSYKSGPAILRNAERWRGKLDVLGEQVNGPLGFFALVDTAPDPKLEYETMSALTMINRASIARVETVPAAELEHFGALVLDVVGGTA